MKPTLILILPLLASTFQDAEPPDPKTTLERGAYVEEYERDLAKAENLYTLAAEVARAQGDDETAKAAAAAVVRVKARRAGAPAAAATSQDEAIVDRIGDLLTRLEKIPLGIDTDHPQFADYNAIRNDLAVYGDAVVPWLEQLLLPAAVEIGPLVVQLDTRMAARMLARMRSETADAALARALQAKDPLIRRAVAEELSVYAHRSLLEQALLDPVPQVREAALDELARLIDPSLLPHLEPFVREGHRDAVEWIGRAAPQRLLDLLNAEDATPELLEAGLRAVSRAEFEPTTENADALLRLAREAKEEWQRNYALGALERNFDHRDRWEDAPQSLRLHVQERLLAEPERYPRPASFELLAEVGDLDAFELLSRELTRWPADRPQGETQWLMGATRDLSRSAAPEDFDRLARLYGELPLDPTAPRFEYGDKSWHGRVLSVLTDLARNLGVPAASLARPYARLDGPREQAYHVVVSEWTDGLLKPGDVSAEELQLLVPVLRDMLGGFQRGAFRAAGALSLAGDVESVVSIVLLSEKRDVLVVQARDRLCSESPERAAEIVKVAVRDGRLSPRSIRHLASPHKLAAFDWLWDVMEDPQARTELLETLAGEIRVPEALERLAELYPEMGASMFARMEAIGRFGAALYEPAIPILGQALEDPSPAVRGRAREAFQKFKEHREALEEFAAWTLGDRAARQQIDELTRLLASDDPAVVLGAVKALGAVRGRAALPELVRLLERDDPELKAAVYEAIERIGD